MDDMFPYVQWFATRDTRTSLYHWALEFCGLDGTNFFRADDPVFRNAPEIECRCLIVPCSEFDAAQAGVKEAILWEKTGNPPKKPQFVKLHFDPWKLGLCCEFMGGPPYCEGHPGNSDEWPEEGQPSWIGIEHDGDAAVRFPCPKCGARGRAEYRHIGRKATCSRCKHSFRILVDRTVEG